MPEEVAAELVATEAPTHDAAAEKLEQVAYQSAKDDVV
jgi:hypothetical protein